MKTGGTRRKEVKEEEKNECMFFAPAREREQGMWESLRMRPPGDWCICIHHDAACEVAGEYARCPVMAAHEDMRAAQARDEVWNAKMDRIFDTIERAFCD